MSKESNSNLSQKYEISDENSDYMYNIIQKIINECGSRPSGSKSERKASELCAEELENYCESVDIEEFETYPRAFMGWIRLSLGFWLISFLIFLISPLNPLIISIVCLALAGFILFIIYKQFLEYEEWTPKFFPYERKTSQNVVGVIKPKGNVRKRVIASAHIDSAFRFNLIHYLRQGYAYFLIWGIVALFEFLLLYIFQFLYSLIVIDLSIITLSFNILIIAVPILFALFFLVVGKSEKIFFGAFKNIDTLPTIIILAVTGYTILLDLFFWNYIFISPALLKTSLFLFLSSVPSLIALFFFVSDKATPGAIDNLSAVAPCICIAKIISEWKNKNSELVPENTEVVIAIVGSEEVGLRGSEAFAKKHSNEYNKIDTTCINYESITVSEFVRIYTREKTTRTDLSPEVYNLLAEACEQLDLKVKMGQMPGIAGGTDAAGLVRGGLKATSIEGIRYQDYLSYYHTDRDNLEMINKERRPCDDIGHDWKSRNIRCAMENGVRAFLKYLELKDKE
ncbi:MAG: M28 family peptidase [Promethearchaeota archaeon]|nr:MAG: M28 family peptidase [Candidatus Lokiarchaeota archaeon]